MIFRRVFKPAWPEGNKPGYMRTTYWFLFLPIFTNTDYLPRG